MVENGFGITWEWPLWLLPLCALAGALFAWLLYRKGAANKPWGKAVNRTLAVLRFLIVTLLCVLLLGPLVRLITRTEEPPVWVLAVDNSLSVAETTDSTAREDLKQSLDRLARELQQRDAAVTVRTLGEEQNDAGAIRFEADQSDLAGMLREIQNDYEGRNLAGVVLVSDGIYNQGMSPGYTPYGFPVYTVGVGDTIPRADINLQNIYVNKVAYQGNRFPLVAEVYNQGMSPSGLNVTVSRNGRTLASERISFENDRQVKQVRFLLEAEEQGMQHYIVNVAPSEGEFTLKNNRKDAFVDIVKGKQKILIAAASPHPDIKAIKSALETNQNYEVSTYIPGLNEVSLTDPYDVVIFHQLPGRNNTYQTVIQAIGDKKPGLWYIVGANTAIPAMARQASGMDMGVVANQTDEVMPVYNNSFGRFTFSPELQERLSEYTPLTIPFGRYSVKGNTEVLLNQRVGSVVTSRPLFTVTETQGRKEALLLGTGLWRWRMGEFSDHQDHEAFNELVSKTVQYLSTREDKRKFRVFTSASEYLEGEPVIFEAQLYNNVYERVYGQEVNLRITDENDSIRNYTFSTSESSSRYRVGGLPAGVYDFTATTSLNGEALSSSGQFSIADLQVETLNLTADFGLLRKMARETGAAFYRADQMEQMTGELTEEETPAILHAEEQRRSIMDMPWLLALFIILISAEWALRRYHGSY
ncbi:hypothetical protein AB9P05_01440 [Roseivirga sp. BDSF3-8]|uniref:hypothetical protein n=1 Tax=Roseivirga sp. BDSF3-8 TaxID=3241598 RepID=UPI003531B3D2